MSLYLVQFKNRRVFDVGINIREEWFLLGKGGKNYKKAENNKGNYFFHFGGLIKAMEIYIKFPKPCHYKNLQPHSKEHTPAPCLQAGRPPRRGAYMHHPLFPGHI
jgi:hypothetical protein